MIILFRSKEEKSFSLDINKKINISILEQNNLHCNLNLIMIAHTI